MIFTLTCWPCLTRGCIICTGTSHCFCCCCYVHYVRSRTWVWICKWHCIVFVTTANSHLLPNCSGSCSASLLCHFPIHFFSFNSLVILLIVYIVSKDPIKWEYLVLEIFLYIIFTIIAILIQFDNICIHFSIIQFDYTCIHFSKVLYNSFCYGNDTVFEE